MTRREAGVCIIPREIKDHSNTSKYLGALREETICHGFNGYVHLNHSTVQTTDGKGIQTQPQGLSTAVKKSLCDLLVGCGGLLFLTRSRVGTSVLCVPPQHINGGGGFPDQEKYRKNATSKSLP